MLATREVAVLGLAIPYFERITVSEREELEVLAATAAEQRMAESQQFFEAIRILAKSRLERDLPPYGSDAFAKKFAPMLEEAYESFYEGTTELLEPFQNEQATKKAIRVRRALEAAGNAEALRSLAAATRIIADTYDQAAEKLERTGVASSVS